MFEDADEVFQLSAEDRAMLDSLDSIQRHAALDLLHSLHATKAAVLATAADTDHAVDMLRPILDQQRTDEAREAALDLLTGMALSAESMRAWAANDVPRSLELLDSANELLSSVQGWHIGPTD